METTNRKYYEYSMKGHDVRKEHQNLHSHRVSFNEYHKVRNRLSGKLKETIITNEFI